MLLLPSPSTPARRGGAACTTHTYRLIHDENPACDIGHPSHPPGRTARPSRTPGTRGPRPHTLDVGGGASGCICACAWLASAPAGPRVGRHEAGPCQNGRTGGWFALGRSGAGPRRPVGRLRASRVPWPRRHDARGPWRHAADQHRAPKCVASAVLPTRRRRHRGEREGKRARSAASAAHRRARRQSPSGSLSANRSPWTQRAALVSVDDDQ